MDLQKLAEQFSAYFTTDKRDDGTEFVKGKDNLTEEQTEKLRDLCHDAHGDMMPDDHRYAFIEEALDALAEYEDPDEITLEPDIYTHDLTAWLGSRTDRWNYCDEAMEEYGDSGFDTLQRISLGQMFEKQEVLGLVRAWLETELEALEDEETE